MSAAIADKIEPITSSSSASLIRFHPASLQDTPPQPSRSSILDTIFNVRFHYIKFSLHCNLIETLMIFFHRSNPKIPIFTLQVMNELAQMVAGGITQLAGSARFPQRFPQASQQQQQQILMHTNAMISRPSQAVQLYGNVWCCSSTNWVKLQTEIRKKLNYLKISGNNDDFWVFWRCVEKSLSGEQKTW